MNSFTAEIDACDRYDITPLHMAAEGGYYECLRLLLDAGANCSIASKYARYTSQPGKCVCVCVLCLT